MSSNEETIKCGALCLLLLAATATAACGEDADGGTGGGSATGGTTNSGGATGSGGAGTGGSVQDDCRRYSTVADISSNSFSGTMSSSFDPDSFTLTSELSDGSTAFITVVATYGSVADFVDEAKTMGRWLSATQVFSGAFDATETYTYDGQKRLSSVDRVEASAASTVHTYSQWDGQGRPTDGVFDLDPGSGDCTGSQLTLTYDDVTRRRTRAIDFSAGTGTDCPSGPPSVSWDEFDEDGNATAQDHSDGDVWTYVTTQTDVICKP